MLYNVHCKQLIFPIYLSVSLKKLPQAHTVQYCRTPMENVDGLPPTLKEQSGKIKYLGVQMQYNINI